MPSFHHNEGGLYGSGPHWSIKNNQLAYFAIFSKTGTGFRWNPGRLEVQIKGRSVWSGSDKWAGVSRWS